MKKIFYTLGILIILVSFFNLSTQLGAVEADETDTNVSFSIRNDFNRNYSVYGTQVKSLSSSSDHYKTLNIQISNGYVLKNSLSIPSNWSQTTDQNSISFINQDNSGFLEETDIESVLNSIVLVGTDATFVPGTLKISLSENLMSSRVDNDNITHYYQFVPGTTSWENAYNTAKTMTYRGLTGYLATITSQEEQDFIYKSIAKYPGWLGGTRALKSDNNKILDDNSVSPPFNIIIGQASQWYWVDGPEAGTVFYNTPTKSDDGPVVGVYQYFHPVEPNNSRGEAFLQFAVDGSDRWNDISNNQLNLAYNQGFFVEYSPYGTQVETNSYDTFEISIPAPVTVNYLDELGNSISDPYNLEGNIGDKYASEQRSISGYTLKEVHGNTVGEFTSNAQLVTYIYMKAPIAGSDVTVKFLDESGNVISDNIVLKGNLNDNYSTEQKEIFGYKLKEVQGNETGQFTTEPQTVIYIYTEVKKSNDSGAATPPITPSTTPSDKLPDTGENILSTMLQRLIGISIFIVGFITVLLKLKKQNK